MKFIFVGAAVLAGIALGAESLPNAYFVMSEDLVRLAAELEPVQNSKFNQQSLQGGIVSGWVSTNGNSSIDIIPDRNNASYVIKVTGTTSAPEQVFKRGRFTVNSSMNAPFVATKRLYFDGSKVKTDPAQVWVDAKITTQSACAPRRMGARIAFKRAVKGTADNEANSEAQIRQEVGSALNSQVEEAMKQNAASGKGPFTSVGNGTLPPSKATLRSESTDTYAIFRATEPGRGAVSREATAPPRLVAGGDLLIQSHESSINNYLEGWLGGTEETDLRLFRAYKLLMNDEPYDLRPHDRTEKWSFLYARQDPVVWWFRDGLVEIRFRGTELRRTAPGETTARVLKREFAVRAQMEPVIQNGKIVLVRRTQAQVVFVDKQPDDDQSLEWKAFLLKKFDALFSETWAFEGLEIPEGSTWERFGALTPVQVHCEGQWLTLGWKLKK